MIRKQRIGWQYLLLAALILASAFLNFWAQSKEGYSNPYYAAAVTSMLKNPAAFFYASFDSGLYITVDKPAFGLWLQAISARIFGVNSFGLLLPSALAGTLSVLLMFLIVRKKWGPTTGVIASAIMTFTPILVALSRTNNLDALLVFFLLCGALLMQNAAEKQSLPLFAAAMTMVGIGFNIKMLQAFLVLPAFLLLYWLADGKWLKKLLHTLVALAVLAVVSCSWTLAVDLTDASERPYVGGSDTNSVLELALGYNGINRLLGNQNTGSGADTFNAQQQPQGGQADPNQMAPDGGTPPIENDTQQPEQNNRPSGQRGNPNASGSLMNGPGAGNPGAGGPGNGEPGNGAPGFGGPDSNSSGVGAPGANTPGIGDARGGGIGGVNENGNYGALRLFDQQLSGLASWFLLPALGMLVVAIALWLNRKSFRSWPSEEKQRWHSILFWGAWLIPMAVFFSIAGFMHRYYVVMIAPATAALSAIAITRAWNSRHQRWLVPLVIVSTLAVQCIFVLRSSWRWLALAMLIAGLLGVGLYLLQKKRLAAVILAIALLIAPVAWSLTPVFGSLNSHIPDVGPDADVTSGFSQRDTASSALSDYIKEHYNGERWALAVSSANTASPIILSTGLPVMAIGGYSGRDSILTLEALKEYVSSGALRYILLNNEQGQSELYQWIRENGTTVTLEDGSTLIDLSGAVN